MGDLATTEQSTQAGSIIAVIERAAINPDVDVDKMERLLAMHKEIAQRDSETAYNLAMVACQKEMPVVVKDADNQQTKSKYAKLETINQVVKKTYTEQGFALSFGTDVSPIDGYVRVTCDIMHSVGHSKLKFVDLPLDDSGMQGKINKTKMHATASSFSYGERYLICMIFNIVISGKDDDGQGYGQFEEIMEHNAALRECLESVVAIKHFLADEEWSMAAEALMEIDEHRAALWVAPTKGGIFTTLERTKMRSNEFNAANKEYRQSVCEDFLESE